MSVREFIKNDEDFEDVEFQQYFTPDRESKINIRFDEININRIENSAMDPNLQNWMSKLNNLESLNEENITNSTTP